MAEVIPPLVRRVEAHLALSKKKMEDELLENRIKQLARLYHSKSPTDLMTWNQTIITVNELLPMVRVAKASLFAKSPEVLVRPNRAIDVMNSKQMELALNYFTRTQHYPKEIRLILDHALLFHFGTVKFGWDADTGIPWIEPVHPLAVRFDATMERFTPEAGAYVGFRMIRTLAQMRQNRTYDPKQLDQVADHVVGKMDRGEFREETTPLVWWEHYLWDYVEGKKRLLLLVQPDDMPFFVREDAFTEVIGLPVRTLVFNPSFDTWYPISLSELGLDQMKEKNALRTQQLIHAERSNRVMAYDVNRMAGEEVKKLENDEANKIIGTDGPYREILGYVEQSNLPSDVYNVEERVDEDLQKIFGAGALDMGASRSNTPSRSATEAAIAENQLRLRSSDRQEIFEEFLQGVYKAVAKLAQAKLKRPLWLSITEAINVEIGSAQIQGDFEYSLSFGSTLPTDKQTERSGAMELYTTLVNNPMVDQLKLTRNLLTKYDIKDVNDWLKALPPLAPLGTAQGGQPPMAPPMDALAAATAPPAPPIAPQALLNGAAQQGTQNGASPLSQGADFRKIAGMLG